MKDNAAYDMLEFLANSESLFSFIRKVTGCGSIGSFSGRVYRMLPESGHFVDWHTDVIDHRLIGNDDAGVVPGDKTRGAHRNFFDFPVLVPERDPIA